MCANLKRYTFHNLGKGLLKRGKTRNSFLQKKSHQFSKKIVPAEFPLTALFKGDITS